MESFEFSLHQLKLSACKNRKTKKCCSRLFGRCDKVLMKRNYQKCCGAANCGHRQNGRIVGDGEASKGRGTPKSWTKISLSVETEWRDRLTVCANNREKARDYVINILTNDDMENTPLPAAPGGSVL